MGDKYKTLVKKDNIKISKKNNKIKINIQDEIKNNQEILKSFESYDFFNTLQILNPDIIEKSKVKLNSILLIINNIDNNDDFDYDSKSYLTFDIEIESKTENCIKLIGKKNSIKIDKEHYEKIDIDEIFIDVCFTDNKLFLEIKIKYLYNTIPIYTENILGIILCKIFKKLLGHYKK